MTRLAIGRRVAILWHVARRVALYADELLVSWWRTVAIILFTSASDD